MKRFPWTLFLLVLTLALPSTAFATPQSRGADDAGAAAYRADDLESARSLWLDALSAGRQTLPEEERARLCYNLGNVASRQDQALVAVGWYTAALRLRPRDEDTWTNLEIARLNAGLEAADRGDLAATVERLLGSLTMAESSYLALFGLVPLALALGLEAWRGGRRWRWLAFGAFLLAVLCQLPWAGHRLSDDLDPVMIQSSERVQVRSEPRSDGERIGELVAGAIAHRLDALPDWTEVEFDGLRRGWVRSEAVFALSR